MFAPIGNMENSVNPDQTLHSEGVWSGSTLFAQSLESIKPPACNIYAPMPGGGDGGGAGYRPLGIKHP